jgi:hypothetical protein
MSGATELYASEKRAAQTRRLVPSKWPGPKRRRQSQRTTLGRDVRAAAWQKLES